MSHDVLMLASGALVFLGALFTFAASVGLLRFRGTMARMHPAAKPQTLGLVLALAGAVVRVWPTPGVGILVLAGLSALATAPVAAQRVGAAAFAEQRGPRPAARPAPEAGAGEPTDGEHDADGPGRAEA